MRWRPSRKRRAVAGLVIAVVVAVAGTTAVLLATSAGGGAQESRVRVPAGLEALAGGASPRRGGHAPGPLGAALLRVADALPRERQVAQLFLVGFDGRFPRDGFLTGSLRQRDWGGVVLDQRNWVDGQQLADLAGEVAVVARAAGHVPPLVAADQPGGQDNAFAGLPPAAPSVVGAGGDPAAAAATARAAAAALRVLHVNMTLAPAADVGVTGGDFEDAVFGDDPARVAAMVRTAADAYRSAGVIAAVGHFPGQGAASQDPNVGTATVGLGIGDLRRRDLVPFRAVVGAAPVVIMSNAVYVAFDGVTPAVLLPQAVRLLRRDLRFGGVVMTDDLAATAPVTGETVGRAAVDALRSGADLLYISGGPQEQEQAYAAVLAATRSGRLPRARLQEALLRVLALKRRYGLLR
jgi:beta-N-acetylhexosaminidase